ncbi:predicted protein [Plenodomus lingam JN3]|uniref:Predicted protein n=1 Tax=Leptosphaeria maculans (strain JN3 / isolate v23.1.3 / race Av1-4-5-6-7-8) TaxID=985895 RepID=E5AF34_LEPMJ|nr:predicted protein [Plenodomus lingam JN3]CBY01823.1 predicted protein [Plenodomus lingam JN3]
MFSCSLFLLIRRRLPTCTLVRRGGRVPYMTHKGQNLTMYPVKLMNGKEKKEIAQTTGCRTSLSLGVPSR